jgi:hypothetical protein
MSIVYIIVGYFGLHGNPIPKAMTFLAVAGCYYISMRICSGHPLFKLEKGQLWLDSALTGIRKRTSVFLTVFVTLRILCFSVLPLNAKSCVGKCILLVAGRAFSILLFHENKWIRSVLYARWLRIRDVFESEIEVKYMYHFKSICLVSLFCVALDGFRILFSDMIMLIIDNIVLLIRVLKQWCELEWERIITRNNGMNYF